MESAVNVVRNRIGFSFFIHLENRDWTGFGVVT